MVGSLEYNVAVDITEDGNPSGLPWRPVHQRLLNDHDRQARGSPASLHSLIDAKDIGAPVAAGAGGLDRSHYHQARAPSAIAVS